MAKIINTSNKPYEWTFSGENYGPLLPGEVGDYPPEIAAHAIKRSEVIDEDLGMTVGYAVCYLGSVDKEMIKKIATYPCPFAATNQCNRTPFRSVDELREHLETHWGVATTPEIKQPMNAVRK